MWSIKTNLKCEKCKSENVYKEMSCIFIPAKENELPKKIKTNVIYGHQPWWYRCYSCNWMYDGEFNKNGCYYKESKSKLNKPKNFYELNHKWKWMPFSKNGKK